MARVVEAQLLRLAPRPCEPDESAARNGVVMAAVLEEERRGRRVADVAERVGLDQLALSSPRMFFGACSR